MGRLAGRITPSREAFSVSLRVLSFQFLSGYNGTSWFTSISVRRCNKLLSLLVEWRQIHRQKVFTLRWCHGTDNERLLQRLWTKNIVQHHTAKHCMQSYIKAHSSERYESERQLFRLALVALTSKDAARQECNSACKVQSGHRIHHGNLESASHDVLYLTAIPSRSEFLQFPWACSRFYSSNSYCHYPDLTTTWISFQILSQRLNIWLLIPPGWY